MRTPHPLASARSNLITRDGSRALARALQTNTSLELLDLGSCSLEDEGAQNLAACLTARNRTLRMCAALCPPSFLHYYAKLAT